MKWRILLILLAAQAALAGAAALLDAADACAACRAGGPSWGLLGFAFYTGLFLTAIFTGPARLLFGAILLGFGVHVILVLHLVSLQQVCWVCFAAAGLSLASSLLSILCDRANLVRLAILLPWVVVFAVGWKGIPRPVAGESAAVRVSVFTQPDCPYCDDLRDRVLPPVRKEFGPRVEWVFRSADDLPGIRRTPTLVVAPGRRAREARVIEGLPTYETLRDAILNAEGKP